MAIFTVRRRSLLCCLSSSQHTHGVTGYHISIRACLASKAVRTLVFVVTMTIGVSILRIPTRIWANVGLFTTTVMACTGRLWDVVESCLWFSSCALHLTVSSAPLRKGSMVL